MNCTGTCIWCQRERERVEGRRERERGGREKEV